jgi:hypothetical protein
MDQMYATSHNDVDPVPSGIDVYVLPYTVCKAYAYVYFT